MELSLAKMVLIVGNNGKIRKTPKTQSANQISCKN